MTLVEAIKAAGYFKPFLRPCHDSPSYYNGVVRDWYKRTRLSPLSLEDLEANDWYILTDTEGN
jgi:hypothetical protein